MLPIAAILESYPGSTKVVELVGDEIILLLHANEEQSKDTHILCAE